MQNVALINVKSILLKQKTSYTTHTHSKLSKQIWDMRQIVCQNFREMENAEEG